MPATASQTITPLGNKVVLRRDEAETITDAGIILPESAKDQPKTAVVESVGPGNLNHETGERIPLNIQEGDRVIFSSYAGTELTLGTEEFLILAESDILAVID